MSTAPPPYSEKNPYQQGPPPVQTAQPTYMGPPIAIVGDYPVQCTCPQCGRQVITRTEKKAGALTWIICLVLFFTVVAWICCFIPFCVDSCKDTEHYCPNCGVLLGAHKQL